MNYLQYDEIKDAPNVVEFMIEFNLTVDDIEYDFSYLQAEWWKYDLPVDPKSRKKDVKLAYQTFTSDRNKLNWDYNNWLYKYSRLLLLWTENVRYTKEIKETLPHLTKPLNKYAFKYGEYKHGTAQFIYWRQQKVASNQEEMNLIWQRSDIPPTIPATLIENWEYFLSVWENTIIKPKVIKEPKTLEWVVDSVVYENGWIKRNQLLTALKSFPKTITAKVNSEYFLKFGNTVIFTQDLYDWVSLVDEDKLVLKQTDGGLELHASWTRGFFKNQKAKTENEIDLVDYNGRVVQTSY